MRRVVLEKLTDPAYAGDTHIPGADVARSTIESSLSPWYDYALLCVGAVELARLR